MALELQLARHEFSASGSTVTATPITPTTRVLRYEPLDASPFIDYTPGPVEGMWPVRHTYANVTEELEIAAPGCAPTALRAFRGFFERALWWNEQFRQDMQTVIRVRDSERHAVNEFFEARLVGGRVEFSNSGGRVLKLLIERFPFWEAAWDNLEVTNNAKEAAGITADYAPITNADDSDPAHCNWIAVTPPAGDVPAPLRIRIRNSYDSPARLGTVRMGWYDRKQSLVLEAENSEDAPTIDPQETRSNYAWASAQRFKWTLPQQVYFDYAGPFRVLANGNLSGSTWQVAAGYELTKMQYGTRAAVAGQNGWTDLGLLTLPPGGYRTPTRYPLRLWLTGSAEAWLDFVVLLPAWQYRRLTWPQGYHCQYEACMVDDPEEGPYYDFNGQKLPIVTGYGAPIQAWPEGMMPFQTGATYHNQVLIFALESASGGADALRSAEIEIFARARYGVLP